MINKQTIDMLGGIKRNVVLMNFHAGAWREENYQSGIQKYCLEGMSNFITRRAKTLITLSVLPINYYSTRVAIP